MTVAPPAPSGIAGPVVAIADVTHRYGRVVALDHISVEIPAGRRVGIIGPDGVGKSCTIPILLAISALGLRKQDR